MRLKKEYLNARKTKDEVKKDVLWIIIANIKNKEIDKKWELTDTEILKIIEKEIKQINETIESLKKVNRLEDIEKEKKKIEILNQFLPEKLSKDELKQIIVNWIKENNIDNILSKRWELFKFLKSKYDWLYDWKDVNEIINEL